MITETADIGGLRLELIDTAGLRVTEDEVEVEGVDRARRAWTTADLVLVVLDISQPLEAARRRFADRDRERTRVVVANKIDLARGVVAR